MSNTKSKPKGWKQILRIALIPILAGVLLAVCFWPSADETPAVSDQPATVDKQHPQPTDESNVAQTISAPRRELPPVALANILAHDPFALPQGVSDELLSGDSPTEEEESSERQARIGDVIESLQEVPLSVVVSGPEGVWARLGDQVVHEGDEIEPGVRIVRITPQGLTLEVVDELPVDLPEID